MSSSNVQPSPNSGTEELLRKIIEQKNNQLDELREFASLERESLEAQLQAIPDLKKLLEAETSRRQELEKENSNRREVSSNCPGQEVVRMSCDSKISSSQRVTSKGATDLQQVSNSEPFISIDHDILTTILTTRNPCSLFACTPRHSHVFHFPTPLLDGRDNNRGRLQHRYGGGHETTMFR